MTAATQHYPDFFTATILQWKHLLKKDKYKDIILSSLEFLAEQNRVHVYGFVIMPNHLHLLWRIGKEYKREDVQRDFLKYTAQRIKADLKRHHPQLLEKFRVNAKDRAYQIWERNSLSIQIYSEKVMIQKLNYIHLNPVRSGLCKDSLAYKYSSSLFYECGGSEWKFLKHYMNWGSPLNFDMS